MMPTRYPDAAKCRAASAPIPLPPPMINAVFWVILTSCFYDQTWYHHRRDWQPYARWLQKGWLLIGKPDQGRYGVINH